MSKKHLDKIVSLCKRKGFVFPNSEIYGGLKASYDYGPLGVDLKKAISEKWWKAMTHNSNIVGLDSSIMVHPDVWEASGHVANFNSFGVSRSHCNSCHHRSDRKNFLHSQFSLLLSTPTLV